jgi:predicted metal-binding membrane protein
MIVVAASPSPLRLFFWRHPEWWITALITLAWSAIVVAQLAPTSLPAGHHHQSDATMAGNEFVGGLLGGSALMVVAMMAPLAIPGSRHVAFASYWHRRYRAQAMFLVGYLGVWTVVAAALTVIAIVASAMAGTTTVLAAATVLAGSVQLSGEKRRALRRCRRTFPLAPLGWRADRDCIRYGVDFVASCIVTCIGAMAIAAAAGHGVVAMAVLAGLQLRERYVAGTSPGRMALAIVSIGGLLTVASIGAPSA